ncbi:MAG: T9SS type A sorting domain-containing protein [Candidatus Cloacimonetes bacterium]|nr:T9SS type A sorting domain-containing protein [Candidatus Cloacimonadota bacterium]MBL7085662.1 T9SS type A sorting domain-containing protein [Candidatus Cloacimonadota bacterium]
MFILLMCITSHIFALAQWTVLVYMAADNSLFNVAFDDMNEMESVGSTDSVNIIVQIDPLEDMSSHFDFSTTRRYLIIHDDNPDSIGSILLDDLGEINSADPSTISNFANWGFSLYPSIKKMLIIWDHGNGWRKDDEITKSVCNDDTFGDNISVADGELNEAISQINCYIDIITFDACLMQMVEVIGEISEYCDFVIGSEEEVPWDGIYYGDDEIYCSQYGIFNYLTDNPTCSAENYSSEIVYRYINSYVSGCQSGVNISMSAVSTSYFNNLELLLKDFTNSFSDTLYHDIYYDTYSQCDILDYKNVDLWQYFLLLSECSEPSISSSAQGIKSIIDSMIVNSMAVYSQPDPELGRMSVYFPQYSFSLYTWEKYYQLSFVKETRWDRFLNFYFNDDNEPPEILEFDISTQGNLVYFSWDAIDASFIKYQLQYRTLTDTSFISILDSTSEQSYQITFPYDSYTFCLTAEDEFGNKSDSLKVIFLSEEPIFKFFPNPYVVADGQDGKFIFSTQNSGEIEIFIYNFAGELTEKLNKYCNENSTYELPFLPDDLASGIYFCLLKTGNRTEFLKLAIIR